MTTAAVTVGETRQPARQTVAEQCAEILSALDPPKLRDMRERTAKAAKEAGASQAVLDAILAVPLVAPPAHGGR